VELRLGRIHRQARDALCKSRWSFWGLNRGGEDHEPSCARCIAIAERAIADPSRVVICSDPLAQGSGR
jgi:hypothetical protein